MLLFAALLVSSAPRAPTRAPTRDAAPAQFTYTSLFGAYSSYLYLRSGLVYGPLLAHVFCNALGLPDFGAVPSHPRRRLIGGAFIVGLAGFIAAVTADATCRPSLFHSPFWHEADRCAA